MKKILPVFFLLHALSLFGTTYYVAPYGNDSNIGDISNPFGTLKKAWSVVSAGDIIYLRGGIYELTSQQLLVGKSGSSGNLIKVWAYPGETPIFIRASSYNYTYQCGLYFEGNYVHFKGIEIRGFTQIRSDGLWAGFVAKNSNHNIFELLNVHHNGHGMRLEADSDDNIILNCDFHHNYDPLTPGDPYGNADGLEVCYINPGNRNIVRGCRMWSNSDDGMDLSENAGYLLVDNCWAWNNGYKEDGVTEGGNGTGFKLGANSNDYGTTLLRTIQNCLAFHNRTWGFTINDVNGVCYVYNNTAYHNADLTDYSLGFDFNDVNHVHVLRNNIAYSNQNPTNEQARCVNAIHDHNSWDSNVTLSASDFLSLDFAGVDGKREEDGSLPRLSFLHLSSSSDLIDAGTNVGLPYGGDAPDLGAYESDLESYTPPTPEFVSTFVEDSYPTVVVITYNLNLANIIPAASSFNVRINSVAISILDVSISGKRVMLTLTRQIMYGDIVTVAYTRPSTNPLQSTEGAWAASLSAQPVTNYVNPVLPVYNTSAVYNNNPSLIEITFSQNLSSSSVPPASAFQVMVNSSARNVSSVSVSGTKVSLTLASPVAYGDAVTVAYTKPSTGALISTSGAEVASFSARNVTNNVLSPIPAYVSSVIENATPSRLEMTYSLALANSVPATSAFSVRVNSTARSVTSVSISGSKVILNLASAVVYGDVVTISYTKPSVNPIKTPEGAEAASITSQPVTNRVSPVVPVYVSSVIENATPNRLEITFSLTLANSVPTPSAFNVQVNSAARTVNSVAVSGTKVILTLSSAVAYGNSVTVAYTKPSVNPIKTASGGEAASFTAQTVKNNVLYVNSPPVVVVKYSTANLSGLVAEINASGTYDVDKDNLSYQWIVPENIPVSSTTSSRIKFLSPVVNESKTYQFVLKVSDGKNVETKNIPVKVNPYKPELLTAEVTKVEASSYSYPNFPFNILDGNIGTMWAAEGDGEWLLLYLSEPFMIDHLKLAFQSGQKSESYFDILGSPDGETWEPILDKSNSCAFSGNLQVFGFPPAKTETAYSFIKLIGHNNAANNWNYISEFQIFGRYVRENRNKDNGQVIIYPNPARDLVNVMIIETALPPDLLRIVSMTGKVVYESKIEPDMKEFQIPVDLINGLYIIQLESGTVTVSAQKLIINK